ncbi:MAG: anti-sigma factor family protein [bacterium]|jgi:hypothetical protein
MNCAQFQERFADYAAGERTAEMDAHVAGCEACAEDVAMWARLDAWPDERPSPALRNRVTDLIRAYRSGAEQSDRPRRRGWFSFVSMRPAFQFGVAVVCVAAGLVGGYHMAGGARSAEIAQLQDEVMKTQRMVALSLLQQQSATERLRGVSYSNRVEGPDREVLQALLHTVKYDTSVDVRLAAIDALRRYSEQPEVRAGIVDALAAPQSPLVQLALIDLAVEARVTQAQSVLREIEHNPETNRYVRERANWGLQQF